LATNKSELPCMGVVVDCLAGERRWRNEEGMEEYRRGRRGRVRWRNLEEVERNLEEVERNV